MTKISEGRHIKRFIKTLLGSRLKEPLYRNSFYLMLNQITNAGAGFFFWIVAARLYPPKDVGLATAIVSAMQLLLIFSGLGLEIGIIGFLSQERDKSGIINSCFTITGIFSFLLAFTYVLGVDTWSPALKIIKHNSLLFFFFLAFTIASTLNRFQSNIFIGFREAKYSFIQSSVAMSRLLLLPLLVSTGVLGIYSSYGIGVIIALLIGNTFISLLDSSYKPRLSIKKKAISNMLHFSLGNYVARIFEDLPNCVLPLMVVNILGAEMNAYFYVAWSTASGAILLIPRASSLSLFAEGVYDHKKLKSNVIKSLKFIFILIIPIITLILLCGNILLSIFGRVYSKNAFRILQILAISALPFAINYIYISIKRVRKEVLPVISIYGFITGFTLLASYILIPKFSLLGIGIAWLIAQGIAATICGVYLYGEFKNAT